MEQPCTTYTIKSIQDGYVWVFKYDLNGDYLEFKKLSGDLKQKQAEWLIGKDVFKEIENPETKEMQLTKVGEKKGNFPINENTMKTVWMPNLKKNFEIKVNLPEITFDLFWKTYPYNALAKKKTANERWNKLTEANKTKIILKIPDYIKLKNSQNQFFPYAEVFINQCWWDN